MGLFQELQDQTILGRGWHLAIQDARRNFVGDPYSFADVAHSKDAVLKGIAGAIEDDTYRTRPLMQVDVPKSALAVRPGSAVDIDDSTVLWAAASLLAPLVDPALPSNVYSWRVKDKPSDDALFREDDLVRYPFLKASTISQHLDSIEPWYEAWPKYQESIRYDFENNGYSVLVETDIVSYFENINREILFETLKTSVPKDLPLIHFLSSMLGSWSIPSPHGSHSVRGIPQGNGVFSFLGNAYLVPLDNAMIQLEQGDVRYYRYMDDVTILAKNRAAAVEALFRMNATLRKLGLNLQAAKTEIFEGDDVRRQLVDSRFERINQIAKRAAKRAPSGQKREHAIRIVRQAWRQLQPGRRALKGSDLRLFQRLLSCYRILEIEPPVTGVLGQMKLNPSHKVLDKSSRFLQTQPEQHPEIGRQCLQRVSERQFVTELQEAYYLDLLASLRTIPQTALTVALENISGNRAWTIRVSSATLAAQFPLSQAHLGEIQQAFFSAPRPVVRRALTVPLSQLAPAAFENVIRAALRHPEPALHRTGLFLEALAGDAAIARRQANSLASIDVDWVLAARIHELDVILKNKDKDARRAMLRCVRKQLQRTRSRMLKTRLSQHERQLSL